MRVAPDGLPRDDWLHFLRHRDLEQVFAEPANGIAGPALEIGCGDGYVTGLLRRRLGEVVPVDLRPWRPVEGACVATAEALPFKSGHFSLVYSSNVLEHVDDLAACLEELKRVTRRDALMVHAMPTITWKALQLALYPAHLLLHRALPRALGPRDAHPVADAARTETRAISRLRTLWPPVHGSATSHLQEIGRFRSAWWARRFSAHGLELVRIANLYVHSAYRFLPYRMLALRDILGRAGLSTVRAYWVRKAS